MSTRNNIYFESKLEKLARILGRNYGVKVILQGNQAMTNGETIVIPMFEDMDDDTRMIVEAFLDHEVAHVKFTDFKCINKKSFKGAFHKHFFNALEDVRIERAMMDEYQGTALSFRLLDQRIRKKMEENREKLPWPIRLIVSARDIYKNRTPAVDAQIEPILAAITPELIKLRGKLTGTKITIDETRRLTDLINAAREKLSAGLPPLTEEEMEEARKQLSQMTGETPLALNPDRKKGEKQQAKGQESLDPATEYSDEDEEQSGDGESDSSESGEKKEGKSKDGKGKGEEEDSDSEGTEASRAKDEERKSKSLDSHAANEGKEGAEKSEPEVKETGIDRKPTNFDGSQELATEKSWGNWSESKTERSMMEAPDSDSGTEFDKHAFSAETITNIVLEKAKLSEPAVRDYRGYYYGQEDKIDPKHVSIPYTREHDEIIDYTGKGDRPSYAERKRNVMKHINPIKAHFERVLKVKENARISPEKERGKLNQRVLAKLCIDRSYRTPFTSFSKIDTTNVAVSLLIDCSGSMHGNKMEVARQTALALGESLKALGITFEANGFNTTGSSALSSAIQKVKSEDLKRFNRFDEALRLMVFKRFDSDDLSGICKAQSGGANADGESIVWAAKRLAERREKRKILIVLSDGQPAYGGANHEVLAGDLKRVIGLLPKAGIQPIGIGIQTEDVKLFYPDYVVVSDVNKLSTTVMRKLAKTIEDGIIER